jgi:hypothetical protein
MIAYLSGAMEFASDEGAAWRNSISFWLNNELGHKTIDPVQESAKIIEKNNAADYREWKSLDPERYANFIKLCVKNDINIVRNKADYIVCLWDENVIKGAGTHAEVTLAFELNKPVYLINRLPLMDLSGWIMACSTEIFDDFNQLKEFLIKHYS